MNSRRDVLIGGACLAASGAAFALRPRRHAPLLAAGMTVAQVVPRTFAEWTSQDVTDLVAPKEEGSLASRLYGETVGRVYSSGLTGAQVMMLLAHGDTQSDDLQLHRPEICYPAFGFAISQSAPLALLVGQGVSVPSRHLVADAPDRRETILYWSRLGEFLPTDRKEQQIDRIRTALKGEIGDGLLARFSVLGEDPGAGLSILTTFAPSLVRAVAPALRRVLIGTRLATALAQTGI